MEERMGFVDRVALRSWLAANHERSDPIWIEFHKDGARSVSYDEALEEALCFGWIDSLVRRIDERVYIQKFSKRRPKSAWSERNRGIVAELARSGRMAEAGLRAIEEAKQNGEWERIRDGSRLADIEALRRALASDVALAGIYDGLTEGLKKHYALYYFDAKLPETRRKRLATIIELMRDKRRIL